MNWIDKLRAALSPRESQETIERAERARQILRDDLFIEAWDGIEASAVEAIASCDTADTASLQKLVLALQATRAMRSRLESWVAMGKGEAERIASREQAEQQSANVQRFRRF